MCSEFSSKCFLPDLPCAGGDFHSKAHFSFHSQTMGIKTTVAIGNQWLANKTPIHF